MKKNQLKKALFFVLTSLVITLGASAQTVDYGTPYGLLESVSSYYQEKEGKTGTFLKYDNEDTFGNTVRVKLDTLSIGQLDGRHWNGNTVTDGKDMEGVYLVNKATGEYLVFGESWGTTPMMDYTGTRFNLRGGKYCRADDLGKPNGVLNPYQVDGQDPVLGTKAQRQGKGYLICLAHNEERVIGRQQTASAGRGTFEHRPYMVARSRDRKEYALNPEDQISNPPGNNDDGQIIFYFHPVKGTDGKQYYVIYTHRQTTRPAHDSFYKDKSENDCYRWETLPEYGNRDTYLCLKSTPSPTADYHMVTYKKFAGKMYNFVATQTQSFYSDDQYYYEFFPASDKATFAGRTPSEKGSRTISKKFAYAMGEDESAYCDKKVEEGKLSENDITLQQGLTSVYTEDSCLWKIVTYSERKNYRVTANIDNPVDMSFLIENHKFYPNYEPYESGGSLGNNVDMGWEWYDAETGNASHSHPYNTSGTETEFHKIGTHYYDRWGWGQAAGTGTNVKQNERAMTQGEEANYVGSIYNGTVAIRQKITGLRAGRYIVYCRAFYSPFGMAHFDNKGNSDFLASATPSYDGGAVSDANQNIINAMALSDKSFLFAIGKNDVERKRDLPNIFSGMMPVDKSHLDKMSKYDLIKYAYPVSEEYDAACVQDFLYTPLGWNLFQNAWVDYPQIAGAETPDEDDDDYDWDHPFLRDARWNNSQAGKTLRDCYNLLRDSTVFSMVTYGDGGQKYFVPRNLTGAARFFMATDRTKHENAFNYRIGLPVEVGEDGNLTIGIKHEKTDGIEEWVCFDNFELVYYGDANHWEFVIDESDRINNTRYHDMFDWEEAVQDRENTRTSTYIIKRGLDPSKFVPIVLPVGLTKKQVKQAFGDSVKISTPSHITYKTIHFVAVSTTGGSETDTCMYAGQPYIVKPSIPAPISSQQTWTRTRFVGENPFDWQVTGATTGGWDNDYAAGKKNVYVAKPGRNNSLLEGSAITREFMPGPIYIADSVIIDKTKHYWKHKEDKETSKEWYDSDYYMASKQWKPLKTFVPTQQRRMKIKGSTDGKEYELQAVSYYDALGNVPPYSYFMSGGNLKFNGAKGSTQSKGFSFYLRIMEFDKTGSAKVFMGNVADFVWEEVTNEATGISDAGQADQNPASDLYYDLQGRAVGSYPSKPGIYIYRGKKIAVK
ncbi:MAG: hypothetical protein IKH48_01375 [Prevotella sp.]|nr:hypothetical protein [Prevotella sp.]